MKKHTVWLSLAVVATASIAFGSLVQFDISGSANFDAIATQAEVDYANANYPAVAHAVQDIYSAAGTPISYAGTDHWFANQYTAQAYWQDLNLGHGVPATVTSSYGTYNLLPGSTGSNIASEVGTANAFRIGTSRGGNSGTPSGLSTAQILFPVAQQGNYETINLLMSGEQTDAAQTNQGAIHNRKAAWVRVSALYSDTSKVLVWTSPRGDLFEGNNLVPGGYGDDRDNIAGGIPSPVGYITNTGTLEQAYKDTFEQMAVSNYLATTGGSPRYTLRSTVAAGGSWYMYDIVGGIDVDETKTLIGLEITVDNGPNLWQLAYPEGEEVNIYGITGVIPEPGTMGLLLGGLGLIALRRIRRKR